MKIQYISSACVLIEHSEIRVLCDPWLSEGIYYGSWFHYPLPKLQVEDLSDVDYIYITHIHPDHCDVASLKKFPKSIPILILDYQDKFLLRLLQGVGFERIIEVGHKAAYYFSDDFFVEMLAADNCDPEKCGLWFGCQQGPSPDKTLQIDSMCVFKGGDNVAVNTNDCPFDLSKTVCQYILQKYQKIDFLFVGYSGAGPYPQCMKDYTTESKLHRAEGKKTQFIQQAISYIKSLKPNFFLPFAGQYTLGGKLHTLNRYRGVPELEELSDIFTPLLEEGSHPSEMVLLNSGDWFDLETGSASAPFDPPNPEARKRYVEEVLKDKKYQYEADAYPDKSLLDTKLNEAYENQYRKLKQLDFTTDTTVYIDTGDEDVFRLSYNNTGCGRVSKDSLQEPFVKIDLDPRLLNLILDRKAHWNNAEIGSHLSYERIPDTYERGVYYFLSYFHCPFKPQ